MSALRRRVDTMNQIRMGKGRLCHQPCVFFQEQNYNEVNIADGYIHQSPLLVILLVLWSVSKCSRCRLEVDQFLLHEKYDSCITHNCMHSMLLLHFIIKTIPWGKLVQEEETGSWFLRNPYCASLFPLSKLKATKLCILLEKCHGGELNHFL